MFVRKQGHHPDDAKGDRILAPASPSGISPELIEHTLKVWQPYYQHKLSRDDGLEIIRNTTGFFKVLSEWSGKQPRS